VWGPVKPITAAMDEHRFIDYFVVTGLLPPDKWKTRQSYVVGQHDPVVDIAVINRTAGENSPPGYICVECTPTGLWANLNYGSLRAPEMFLCYRRGRDKPPVVDIRFDCFIILQKSCKECIIKYWLLFALISVLCLSNADSLYFVYWSCWHKCYKTARYSQSWWALQRLCTKCAIADDKPYMSLMTSNCHNILKASNTILVKDDIVLFLTTSKW